MEEKNKPLHVNLEMERSVIAAGLLEPCLVDQPNFKPECFSDPLCKKACSTMLDLAKNKSEIDILTVCEHDKTIPMKDLIEIQSSIATTAAFDTWTQQLEELAYLRVAAVALAKIHTLAAKSGVKANDLKNALAQTVNELLAKSATGVIETRAKLADICQSLVDEKPMLIPVDYGIDFCERVEHYKGQVHCIGANPGIGKTALILTIMACMIPKSLKVLLFCKESVAKELITRLIGIISEVPASDIMRGVLNNVQKKKVKQAIELLASFQNNWNIIGMGEFSPNIESTRDAARRWAFTAGSCDMLGLDYIQAFGKAEAEGASQQEIFQRVGHTMEGISSLTEELYCGTIALSQFNRDTRKLKANIPTQTSFMGASEIEFNSHIMSVMYRKEEDIELLKKGIDVYPTMWKTVKTRLVRPFGEEIGFKSSIQKYVYLHKYSQKDFPDPIDRQV